MIHEPLRSRSRALMIGAVVAALGLAASAALAFVRPQDKMGDATIVVGKDSGAMYVVENDVVHPVMSLSSARLVTGRPDDPVTVKESELSTHPRGPLVGIPGSPASLALDPDARSATWSVCDTLDQAAGGVATSTVLVTHSPLVTSTGDNGVEPLGTERALLWEHDGLTYLVYEDVRARVDLSDAAVVRALGLDGAAPVPVSTALLDSVREVPALGAPTVVGAGEPTSYPFGNRTVGSVVTVDSGEDEQHYVALRDGVQPIGTATARLLRFVDSQGRVDVDSVTPDTLRGAPRTRNPLPVSTFPDAPPRLVDTGLDPVTCLSWRALPSDGEEGPTSAEVNMTTARTVPLSQPDSVVTLAGADGSGPAVDAVHVAPGSGYFVQTTGVGESSARRDSLFYVSDTGVRFGIADQDSAAALGFSDPVAAPWAIVSLCAPGPVLGISQARIAHDGVAPDPDAAVLDGG